MILKFLISLCIINHSVLNTRLVVKFCGFFKNFFSDAFLGLTIKAS